MKGPNQIQLKVGLLATASLCWTALIASPAQAQTPQGADQAADADGGEIVVTARKRLESAKDVPISMTVLGGDAIVDKGIKQLQDIMQFAPNLQQSNGMGGGFRTMRGAGSVGSNIGFEQSTGLFIDEVSFGRNPQSYLPLYDVQRVEVLRGPQVITFGNSTTSGAISVTTKKPGQDFEADASVLYEANHHQTTLRGGITVPLGDAVSLRVAGFMDRIDKGWIKIINEGVPEDGPKTHDASGRITFVAQPTADLTLTLKYQHDRVRTDGSNIITTSNRSNFPFVQSTVFGPLSYKGSGAPFNLDRDHVKLDNDTFNGRIDWNIGDITLTSNTSYWEYDYDYINDSDTTTAPIAVTQTLDKFSQFAQELRLAGKIPGVLDYYAGVYYQRDKQNFKGVYSANRAALGIGDTRPAFARVVGADQKAETISGFVSLSVPITEQFTVEPSLRYTDISRNGTQFTYGAEVMSTVPTTAYDPYLAGIFGATPHQFNLSVPESHWMPQVILTYRPNRDVSIFAKYTKGAKSGGIDVNYVANVPSEAVFGAEKVNNFEAGIKSDLFDRRLSSSLTFFYGKYRDLQVSIYNDPRFIVRNAGGQRSTGIEFETTFRASRELTIGGSLTYLDAKYTDFRNAACTLDQSLTRPAPCTQDLTGHPSGFSSKWYGTAFANYSRPVGEYRLNLDVDAAGRSSYSPTTNDDRVVGLQKGYILLNARAEIGPDNGAWTIGIFGRNLTNVIYTNFVTPGGAGQSRGVSAATLERTRQIGAEMRLKF